ncbi:MAG: response regulator [Lachnospiraceae bacterium]|nr:response regulator [Lachnospiraceae bacterium]
MAKILIVDDSKMSRRMLKSILEGIGHEIIGEAANGEEGLCMYKELKPDAVTMDITMPDKDGIACLRDIREYDEEAKVIMLTAAGQSSKMLEALKLGAKEFICKPYEPEQVINALKEVLKK